LGSESNGDAEIAGLDTLTFTERNYLIAYLKYFGIYLQPLCNTVKISLCSRWITSLIRFLEYYLIFS